MPKFDSSYWSTTHTPTKMPLTDLQLSTVKTRYVDHILDQMDNDDIRCLAFEAIFGDLDDVTEDQLRDEVVNDYGQDLWEEISLLRPVSVQQRDLYSEVVEYSKSNLL